VALLIQLRVILACGAALALASCEGSASLGHVSVWLGECEGHACTASASLERFEVQGFFEPSASRFAPNGFYAYWELPRADGGRGLVELDVPTDAVSDAPLEHYQVSYRELDDARLRYEASAVQGKLVLPRSYLAEDVGACACDDAAFALRFAAAGADGELGTEDDRVRELTLGQLSRSDERCATTVARLGDEAGLRVALRACVEPARPVAPRAAEPPTADPSWSPSCSYGDCTTGGVVFVDPGTSDGCGSSDDAGGGCDDSGSDDSSYDDSSDADGCDGSSSDDSGGCEGDTSSQDQASCAVTRLPNQRPSRHGSSFFGTGLPLALFFLWYGVRSARLRARATRTMRSAQRAS